MENDIQKAEEDNAHLGNGKEENGAQPLIDVENAKEKRKKDETLRMSWSMIINKIERKGTGPLSCNYQAPLRWETSRTIRA